MVEKDEKEKIRTFETGATRDAADDKPDYEGFLSPLVIRMYGEYMNKHRLQPDGQLRDSDNWQKGIPKKEYVKSLLRHVIDLWLFNRGYKGRDTIEDALCGILFNVMGYMHELEKEKLDSQ